MIRNPYAKTNAAPPPLPPMNIIDMTQPPPHRNNNNGHVVVPLVVPQPPPAPVPQLRAPMHNDFPHHNVTTTNNVPEVRPPLNTTGTNRIVIDSNNNSSRKEPPPCTNAVVIDLTTGSTTTTTSTHHFKNENQNNINNGLENSKCCPPKKRPSSSSSLSTTSQLSSSQPQPQPSSLSLPTTKLTWKSTQNINIPPPHPRVTTTSSSSSTARMMLDRYYTALPPEIRFAANDPIAQPVSDEYRTALIQNATLSEPLLNGWSLYSHQKRAILVALLMRRHILALDMGLGKTVIACGWARAFCRTRPQVQVVILCPVSLKEEWHRTAQDICGLSMKTSSDTTTGPTTKPKKKAKTTATSSSSSPLEPPRGENGVVTICSWAKVPHPHDICPNPQHPYVVVADEAHSMQSMTSGRTRDALQLMLAPNAVGVLLLTGTPVRVDIYIYILELWVVEWPLRFSSRPFSLTRFVCGFVT